MFGYIRAFKPDLRMREYELYKGIYCSLCKDLGKNFGPLSRFTLSYDFTFLAMLRMSMRDRCPKFSQKKCAFNPLVKCNYTSGDDLEFASATAMLMLYYKIIDNIDDSKGIKKLLWQLSKPIFSKARKKALKKYAFLDEEISKCMKSQKEAENAPFSSIDAVCEPTAQLLSALFSYGDFTPVQKRVLERLGYCMGKWVYLADALDDYEEDAKTGSYNPIISSGTLDKKAVVGIMNMCVGEAGASLELLEMKRYEEIFRNIIYQGMPHVTKQIGTKEFSRSERSL